MRFASKARLVQISFFRKDGKEVFKVEKERKEIEQEVDEKPVEEFFILEEITIEELAVDGICGVY